MAQAVQSPSPPAFVSADTILRSSDGVDFHVWRGTSSDAEIPVIPVAENSQLLDVFLRFWYPGATQKPFEDLDQLADVIELAMMKYDLQYLAPPLRRQLVAYKEAHCLSVFALACRYGWDDIAKEVARQALALNLHFLISAKSPHLKTHHWLHQQLDTLSFGTDAEYVWLKCATCEPYPWQQHSDYDSALIAGAHEKIVACGQLARPCPCQNKGMRDLFKFIVEEYVPAINEAIEAVPLRI
ncbi:hypothetical protein R3P38DRAFT_2835334 [Favolaschia claudopus]|uniref:BTB domain-containing protein n=1 Tax=Favolaschia claudopus TaxID=2862362 RepID=A0AAW0EBM7_9AGAR